MSARCSVTHSHYTESFAIFFRPQIIGLPCGISWVRSPSRATVGDLKNLRGPYHNPCPQTLWEIKEPAKIIRKEKCTEFSMLYSGLFFFPGKCVRLADMSQKGLWCMMPPKQRQPKVKRAFWKAEITASRKTPRPTKA